MYNSADLFTLTVSYEDAARPGDDDPWFTAKFDLSGGYPGTKPKKFSHSAYSLASAILFGLDDHA